MKRASTPCNRVICQACVLILVGWELVAPLSAQEPTRTYRLLPETILLSGPGAIQRVQLILAAETEKGYEEVVGIIDEESFQWEVQDPSTASFDVNRVQGMAPGRTRLTARGNVDGKPVEVSSDIVVSTRPANSPWDFVDHVQSVLSRRGCNSGACHGALAGKGGFRLSLRGYDPTFDHFTIVKEDRGRRSEMQDPEKSLILAKPSGKLPHKGGTRLPVGSQDYRILKEWLAQGAPAPKDTRVPLKGLAIYPDHISLEPGLKIPLLVVAEYEDGHTEDVTDWAKFSATNAAVAEVTEDGMANVVGAGQGAIVVWFQSRIALAHFAVPFPAKPMDPLQPASSESNPIDRLVLQQLRRLRLPPSDLATDREFIRRAYLDTIGILPSPEEVDRFVSDSQSDKRRRLVEQLLTRPEFVDYWTYRVSDMLMLNGNLIRPEPIRAYYQWIRSQVAENVPWDRFVQSILTSRGDAIEHGATNFFALNQDPESMTENACQAFLGLSIGCAKCHNHPLEKWTNDQYYAMANFFSRVRAKGWGGDGREGDGLRTVIVLDRGELIQPSKGKSQIPTPLDGSPIDPEDPSDRRIPLAHWLTSPDNPYFTRAIVNRVWANFFSKGIVNPVDDLRMSNPPVNEPLLDYLTHYLIDHEYDLKCLMRLILTSDTYQRSSMIQGSNDQDPGFFSRYYPRRLMAEVLHDAVCQVTEVPSRFSEIEYLGSDRRPTDFYPLGTKAIQLYDAAVGSPFLKTFGRNPRRIVCECERSDEPSIVQVLHLSNGVTLNDKLSSSNSWVAQLLTRYPAGQPDLIDEVYLRCLGRSPTPVEFQETEAILSESSQDELRLAVEDFVWSLLTSREFLFNH